MLFLAKDYNMSAVVLLKFVQILSPPIVQKWCQQNNQNLTNTSLGFVGQRYRIFVLKILGIFVKK